jgi:ABC-type lipoprotein release transport system permease subunit
MTNFFLYTTIAFGVTSLILVLALMMRKLSEKNTAIKKLKRNIQAYQEAEAITHENSQAKEDLKTEEEELLDELEEAEESEDISSIVNDVISHRNKLRNNKD